MIGFIRSYTYHNTNNICVYNIYHWDSISIPFKNLLYKGNITLVYERYTYIYHRFTYCIILGTVYTTILSNRITSIIVACASKTHQIAFTIISLYTHHVAQNEWRQAIYTIASVCAIMLYTCHHHISCWHLNYICLSGIMKIMKIDPIICLIWYSFSYLW